MMGQVLMTGRLLLVIGADVVVGCGIVAVGAGMVHVTEKLSYFG